ncbi:hypothetical protein J3Q64DRAFT_1885461 [Phycomyces blakesleeanus]|uniref:Uncharacterized protein n=2 Tax=Phycomyces blakesleeanus TaxID=4837 RepID=A0A167LRJ1_PHYB8|nr:hypothetical protein PHYBLDRAFT_148168 [Phycomyces blakesleeanus NRRL 1555(-)]OAD70948.1 hypothetical protein PHYBLDRAFT_148168 [Phycomyces blakesleeanus NRRL 1555(-)]|eukprot:XP_018288988.1 hypothetical protein PHYBLDRAFT_148168 [Phycomyces blakesleeanus NRRL 1555(-)]
MSSTTNTLSNIDLSEEDAALISLIVKKSDAIFKEVSKTDELEDEEFDEELDEELINDQILPQKRNESNNSAQQEKVEFISAINELYLQQTLKAMKLINQDIFFLIYIGSVSMIQERVVIRRRANQGTYRWWTIDHPNLTDEETGERAFKTHYRITRSTFENLVNLLKNTAAYSRFTDEQRSTWNVAQQVAVVLWRFCNTHFGYRIAKATLGVGHGSYNEFTVRFINTMTKEIANKVIVWPSTIQKQREIANGFATRTSTSIHGHDHLKDVVGAIDGKLVQIEKPRVDGN